MNIRKHISAQIKQRRKNIGYSQLQFAQLLDLSRTSVMNLESGRHMPTMEGLYKICSILDCTPNDILPPIKKLKQVVTESVVIKRVIRKGFKPVKL